MPTGWLALWAMGLTFTGAQRQAGCMAPGLLGLALCLIALPALLTVCVDHEPSGLVLK